MHIVVTGGTGFIGRALACTLSADGHHVTVLSRNRREAVLVLTPDVRIEPWDGQTRGTWERALDEADAVVNLAGSSIAEARWTPDRKRALVESRVGTTRLLVQALARVAARPPTLINASAIGFYGPRDATPVDESTPAGSGFLADLCVAWEREARQAEALGMRMVQLRIGMVLEKDGGALPRMLPPFRAFLGGPISPGHQWMSWIHRQDLIGLIRWILTHPSISGPVNAVAPSAVTMREFCHLLGQVLHRPSWLPVPELALRVALGELGTLLTTGQRVEPRVALRSGYAFRFPTLKPALQDILMKPTTTQQAA
jgi:uncharacterized protein (TIGR01777 family)